MWIDMQLCNKDDWMDRFVKEGDDIVDDMGGGV